MKFLIIFLFIVIESDKFLLKTKNGKTFRAEIGKYSSGANWEHNRHLEDLGEEYQIIPQIDVVNSSSHKYLKEGDQPKTARGYPNKSETKNLNQEEVNSILSKNLKRKKGQSAKRKNGSSLGTADGYVTKQHSDNFWQDIMKASSPIHFKKKDPHPTTSRGCTELQKKII